MSLKPSPRSSCTPRHSDNKSSVRPGILSQGPPPASDTTESRFVVVSVILACWASNYSNPLAKFSGLASLTALDVPHEKMDDCGEGGVSDQFMHLLCSASHGSWALAPIPQLRALVALSSTPWQVPQSVALHWSHSLHRSGVSRSERFMGRLGSVWLCLAGSSWMGAVRNVCFSTIFCSSFVGWVGFVPLFAEGLLRCCPPYSRQLLRYPC